MRNSPQIGYIPIVLFLGVCILMLKYLPDDFFYKEKYPTLPDASSSEQFNEVGYLLYKSDLYKQAQKSFQEDNSNRGVQAVRYLQGKVLKPLFDQHPELLTGDPIAAANVFSKATYKDQSKQAISEREALHAELVVALRALPNNPPQSYIESSQTDQYR